MCMLYIKSKQVVYFSYPGTLIPFPALFLSPIESKTSNNELINCLHVYPPLVILGYPVSSL